MTLNGCPYQNVSLDTFDLGKVCLTRGARNLLKRNQLLAVCCLSSGHLSLEQIDSLAPNSVAGALWHVEKNYKTRIMAVYSDNYSSLCASALGLEMDQFQRLHTTVDSIANRTQGLTFHTNVSYTKARNYVEGKIRNICSSVLQLTTLHNLVLNFEEALNLNNEYMEQLPLFANVIAQSIVICKSAC